MKVLELIKKYWYLIVILVLLYLLFLDFKEKYHNGETEYERSKIIEQLRDSVNNLVEKNNQVQAKYDLQQQLLIQNITKENEKIITKIINIPNYTDGQRDSLWSGYSITEEDSVSRRYWDILNKKTGGRNITELSVQGVLQDKP